MSIRNSISTGGSAPRIPVTTERIPISTEGFLPDIGGGFDAFLNPIKDIGNSFIHIANEIGEIPGDIVDLGNSVIHFVENEAENIVGLGKDLVGVVVQIGKFFVLLFQMVEKLVKAGMPLLELAIWLAPFAASMWLCFDLLQKFQAVNVVDPATAQSLSVAVAFGTAIFNLIFYQKVWNDLAWPSLLFKSEEYKGPADRPSVPSSNYHPAGTATNESLFPSPGIHLQPMPVAPSGPQKPTTDLDVYYY